MGRCKRDHLHEGASWPMGGERGRVRTGGGSGGRLPGTVRGWPQPRRGEPPARDLPPGPRCRRYGGAGTCGAARPRYSSSTTSPWMGGPRAWAWSVRISRRRCRPPRFASRQRRRRRRLLFLPAPSPRRPALPAARSGPRRTRACSAPRPPASAWTRSARGEWGRGGLGGCAAEPGAVCTGRVVQTCADTGWGGRSAQDVGSRR